MVVFAVTTYPHCNEHTALNCLSLPWIVEEMHHQQIEQGRGNRWQEVKRSPACKGNAQSEKPKTCLGMQG